MASAGSAVLALQATAVAAMLAMMVLPSSGRCPSLGPAPPPPSPPAPIPLPPAPAPAPAPLVSCGACARSFGSETCNSLCVGNLYEKCPCLVAQGGLCHECTAAVQKCTDNCTGDSCDCGAAACKATCSLYVKCIGCAEEKSKMCRRTCTGECMAKCNGP